MKSLPLTNGNVAFVDDEAFDVLSQWKWMFSEGYAVRYERKDGRRIGRVHMHRVVLGLSKSDPRVVDHINGNKLDNRRANLRPATRSQNGANRRKSAGMSSRYKGVSWQRKTNKWVAALRCDQKWLRLGLFEVEEDAARAYDKVARETFGEFALLNFPDGEGLSCLTKPPSSP